METVKILVVARGQGRGRDDYMEHRRFGGGAVKLLFCMTLMTNRSNYIYLSKPTEYTTQRRKPNVNYKL